MFNENLDNTPHHDNKARNLEQLKRKFNNLLENATDSDLKRIHRILDLVEVHNYSICKCPLNQHIWYNKNKFEKLYQELKETQQNEHSNEQSEQLNKTN